MPSGTSSENSLNANFRERRHGEVRSDYARGRLNRLLGWRMMSGILHGTAQTSVRPSSIPPRMLRRYLFERLENGLTKLILERVNERSVRGLRDPRVCHHGPEDRDAVGCGTCHPQAPLVVLDERFPVGFRLQVRGADDQVVAVDVLPGVDAEQLVDLLVEPVGEVKVTVQFARGRPEVEGVRQYVLIRPKLGEQSRRLLVALDLLDGLRVDALFYEADLVFGVGARSFVRQPRDRNGHERIVRARHAQQPRVKFLATEQGLPDDLAVAALGRTDDPMA